MSLICLIKATEYEDPTKVAMFRTTDLLFSFILQYFFLGIESNVFNIIGSTAITVGVLMIMGFKLIEKNYDHTKANGNSFLRIIFYKF